MFKACACKEKIPNILILMILKLWHVYTSYLFIKLLCAFKNSNKRVASFRLIVMHKIYKSFFSTRYPWMLSNFKLKSGGFKVVHGGEYIKKRNLLIAYKGGVVI
jgi:hypothetical protein